MTYEFIYEFMYMKNIVKSYLNSGVPRFQMLDAAEVGKLRPPRRRDAPNTHPDPPCAVEVQSDGQRRPAQALLLSNGPAPLPWPDHRPGDSGQAGEYVLEQLRVFNRKTFRGRTVRWQVHASAADSWEPAEPRKLPGAGR